MLASCIQPGLLDHRALAVERAVPLCFWDLRLCSSESTKCSMGDLGSVGDGLCELLWSHISEAPPS